MELIPHPTAHAGSWESNNVFRETSVRQRLLWMVDVAEDVEVCESPPAHHELTQRHTTMDLATRRLEQAGGEGKHVAFVNGPRDFHGMRWMTMMLLKNREFSTRVTALPPIVVSAPTLGASETRDATHDGKVVRIHDNTLVMTSKDGQVHSHMLAPNAEVTCDGKACKLGDLKAGMKIRVTTKQSEEDVATEMEALDKNPNFT